jgi:hypothetical protein
MGSILITKNQSKMKIEKLSNFKFGEITNDAAALHLGGKLTQGSLFGYTWSGDSTERSIGTGNCYLYDFNGMLNGRYITTGWTTECFSCS